MKFSSVLSRAAIIGTAVMTLSACGTSGEAWYLPVADDDFANMYALQMTKIMGNGINLGNTFEATSSSFNKSVTTYETAWGQPVTTKAMMEAYKAAGFDSVRIPVAWTNTMDWSNTSYWTDTATWTSSTTKPSDTTGYLNGDYQINEDYLERVGEVVQWAQDAGLIVIINDHWDNQWWGMFSKDETIAFNIYNAIWSQVGEYFKDYDLTLIFEGGNEELGSRFNDAVYTVSKYNYSGSLSTAACYKMINKVNQYFVDLIRSQEGNNQKRFLLIPGYDTNISETNSASFAMPDDSSNSIPKLMVSVHFYDPSTYCILEEDASWGTCKTSWGTDGEKEALSTSFYYMSGFTEQGYGVIIGEYGVAKNKSTGKKKDGMEDWMTAILDECDWYNYCPMLWDCNTFFSKSGTLGFTDSEIAAVYKNRNYQSEQ